MPGAPDMIDAIDGTGFEDSVLLMKGQASLYSSQGLLSGMLSLYRDRLVWKETSSKYTPSFLGQCESVLPERTPASCDD
ncbi:hypothetical protein FBU59_001261 [Linderina macrospora]|uniref:Uncharacterized protein n=1 Tax=Linderina macrospora TaxID=4868 RepID=A0ACC1JEL5_9FUNG|nr:hypothetical protein FBU59_001261 [Linderina macrospora]